MYLDFTSLLRVVHVVKSLLHCFPQSQQTVVPQQHHLENTSVIQHRNPISTAKQIRRSPLSSSVNRTRISSSAP